MALAKWAARAAVGPTGCLSKIGVSSLGCVGVVVSVTRDGVVFVVPEGAAGVVRLLHRQLILEATDPAHFVDDGQIPSQVATQKRSRLLPYLGSMPAR